MTVTPAESHDRLFDLGGIRTTAKAILQPGQEPRIQAQDKEWTSFAILFADPSALQAISTECLLSLQIDMTVEAGVVAIAAIDAEDRVLDNAILDAKQGRIKTQLLIPPPGDLDAIILRTFNEFPVSVTLHGISCQTIGVQPGPGLQGTLAAVYDLSRIPISFDIAMFLVASEMERVRQGLQDIHVIFAPSDHNYTYNTPTSYPDAISQDSLNWRFDNIPLAMLRLLPTVSGFTISRSRLDAYHRAAAFPVVYPPPIKSHEIPTKYIYETVNLGLDRNFSGSKLKAQKQGLVYVDQWLAHRAKGRKLVTITVRQYGFDATRNSNMPAWLDFARSLDPETYYVVFVPDTDVALGDNAGIFGGFSIFPEAAINLGLRMAFYERAWLNCVTNGGPSMMLLLSEKCPFLLFRIHVEGTFLASANFLNALGFLMGKQRPYCLPTQRIVWGNDDLETIKREFAAMEMILDGN